MTERFRLIEDKCRLIKSGRYILVKQLDRPVIQTREGYPVEILDDHKMIEETATAQARKDFNSRQGCTGCPIYLDCFPEPSFNDDGQEPTVIFPALISKYSGPIEAEPVPV